MTLYTWTDGCMDLRLNDKGTFFIAFDDYGKSRPMSTYFLATVGRECKILYDGLVLATIK